jgi:cation diffusion facilitator CzcD-associated flavoprotein CzcO
VGSGSEPSSSSEATATSRLSAATRSAACGERTRTRARRATFSRTSTRSRSRPATSGPAATPPQPEILSYLERCTDRFGLRPHIHLNATVEAASFDETSGRWTLTTDAGERSFDVLVTACGQLKDPAIPQIEGVGDFAGPAFHSAEWDHEVDLAGRRAAVLGTGASAIQFVPEVAKVASDTTIYQRSAPWILPKADRAYPEWERRLFRRFPLRVAAARLGLRRPLRVRHLRLHGHRVGDAPAPEGRGKHQGEGAARTRTSAPRRRPTTRSAASW